MESLRKSAVVVLLRERGGWCDDDRSRLREAVCSCSTEIEETGPADRSAGLANPVWGLRTVGCRATL